MADTLLHHLRGLLEEASQGLRSVAPRRMFGCDTLFAGGQIYGLIWKEGRIGVRLPDPELFADAMALPGSERWAPGSMAMAHWVLLPEEYHDDTESLGRWVRHAHALALSGVSATPRKAAKAAPAKKPAAKAKKPAAAKAASAKKPAAPAKKPATKKSTTKKPATKKPATKKPATKKPATKKPATKKPATKKPATKKPAAKRPAAKKPAAKRPAKRA